MTVHAKFKIDNHITPLSEPNEFYSPYYSTPKRIILKLIEQIPDENLRQAIQSELNKLIKDYDQFTSVLQQRSEILEQEYENLQNTEESYQRRYEKAVREMQFYKKKYTEYQDLPTSPLPSSVSSDTSYYPPQHLPPPPPIASSFQLSRTPSSSSSSNASTSFNPIVNELSPAPLNSRRKPSTNIHPEATLTRSATIGTPNVNSFMIQQRRVDPLSFGGSDSFWDTFIKSSDTSIEKTISNFLKRGGSPNTAKQSSSQKHVKYGYGLIHTVVAFKAANALSLLLEQGANPNAMTLSQLEEDKVTPGYLAASMGWLHGLEMLVAAGTDLSLARGAGNKNKSCLHVAAENCHITTVEYIVRHTASNFHSQVDSMGGNALHYAAISGHTDLLSYLIQTCQLPVDVVDMKGETALHWASRAGQLEAATFLIERCGANVNFYVAKKSNTPYDLAKQGNHKRLLDYYKKIGALSMRKLEKKKQEEIPVHLHSTLSKNGLFGL